MQVVNGKENEIADMLRDFSLGNYEATMYFALLVLLEIRDVCVAERCRR